MIRITDTVFRAIIATLATIAVLSFAYNQVAQARAVRYRPISDNSENVLDTWTARLCFYNAECYPIVSNVRRPPPPKPATPTIDAGTDTAKIP